MQSQVTGKGEASAKIILIGEHAVVYGEPALAIPFPTISTQVLVQPGQGQIDCYYYKGNMAFPSSFLKGIHAMIRFMLDLLNRSEIDFDICIESTIPPQRGLGSSAAVSIALTRAVFDYFKADLDDEKLRRVVSVGESIHHEDPSGLDMETIIHQMPIFFTKDTGKECVKMDIAGFLVVADTGKNGCTKTAVSNVQQYLKENNELGMDLIKQIGNLARKSKEDLKNQDLKALAYNMNACHQLLKEIGVSNSTLDAFVIQAREAGAIGAKMTGGGQGGCMIALCENLELAHQTAKTLKNMGAKHTWISNLGELKA